jgi:ATP-dependent helicase/nuclease subunit B
LSHLDASLSEIGVKTGLEADPAGEQLLELLAALRHELAASDALFSFVQWRRWLARELEAATFHDRGVESPVVFTYLAATRLRSFDAVLICGCDAQHLPGPETHSRVFNQGVRAELGLPMRRDELRAIEDDLSSLIVNSGVTLLTWQRQALGEDNLLSPLIARLVALHELAYGDPLEENHLARRIVSSQIESPQPIPLPAITRRPQPRAPAELVPREISASAYNSLVACPYQFYARHILKLGEFDEVLELLDKRDYGSRLHAVLAKFHRAFPVLLDSASEDAQRALDTITDEIFADALANNYLARAWVLRWKALIPVYLDWQREREAAGWRWYAGEAKRRLEIITAEGRKFAIVGRIDRVDQHLDGRVAVVDYKTTPKSRLSAKLKHEGEDVQLPLYALLWGGAVAAALFLTLDNDQVKPVEQSELDDLVEANRSRIAAIYDRLHAGVPLPAHGVDEVCRYCEARGLCRKDYWT